MILFVICASFVHLQVVLHIFTAMFGFDGLETSDEPFYKDSSSEEDEDEEGG